MAMSSYTKRIRAAYIERAGGEPAERRRVALVENGLSPSSPTEKSSTGR
jgi:hypothetical protein